MSLRESVFLKEISRFSLAVSQCLLADKWVCLCPGLCCRTEHVCTGLRRQQLQPSRNPWRGVRPGEQSAELGRVLREAAGGPLWSPALHGELHSTSRRAAILNRLRSRRGAVWHGVSVELCHLCSRTPRFSLRRPSWGLKWVQRTFYSGRPVKSSGRSLLALWMRYGEFGNVSFLCVLVFWAFTKLERSLPLLLKPFMTFSQFFLMCI